jgi:hypothetical protein
MYNTLCIIHNEPTSYAFLKQVGLSPRSVSLAIKALEKSNS